MIIQIILFSILIMHRTLCTVIQYIYGIIMIKVSVNQFRAKIKAFVDEAVSDHEPVLVHRRGGEDFVVISAEDWEREQETLYVLQNNSLMTQIAESLESYKTKTGYIPTVNELDEITNI